MEVLIILLFPEKKLKQFSTPEDLFALAGIGFAGIAALWASINLVEVTSRWSSFKCAVFRLLE